MCSASLTAIHEACEHLLRDECELAIAGGVNLYLHPSNFVMLCSGRMLSPSGQCRTFGSGADGMAPGEGVGTVLLKRLSQAEADGDHIYGVIKGSSINHGGKTNGYTVPNPTAQKEVVRGAISRAGVDARAISYIEAHGTGTELGDPIEIAGLTQAFREYTTDQQFCAIGSAKSNIGHCESAAGIAGLTKVLMQMKYGQLAPSLHTEELNPNIDFEKTPFVVQRELGEWKRPRITAAGQTRERPRMAGISSFGAGGANAHLIVEEYINRRRGATAEVIDAYPPAVIALSATTEDRLRVRANQLLSAIDDRGFSDTDLPSIAYTLQVGREAMEHRLAFTVSSLRELREKLTRFTAGDESIDEFYRGEVKQNKKALALFTADEDLQKAIDAWVEKKKYCKLLDFWVRGLAIDWNRLYEQPRPRRISLPSYPFARERYWIPRAGLTGAASIAMAGGGSSALHPLLHLNISDFDGQRFSCTLTGEEFFLRDHVVGGRRILPGVAYLEMARAAMEESCGFTARDAGEGQPTFRARFEDVIWLQPAQVQGGEFELQIGLEVDEYGEVEFEIYSQGVKGERVGDEERVIHCRGRAEIVESGEAARIDLGAIQSECGGEVIEGRRCYEVFNAIGIEYGPAFQSVETVNVGEGQTLVKLKLPEELVKTQSQYALHPSMLDGALQGCAALMLSERGDGEGAKAALLFSMEEVEVSGECVEEMWAWVRVSAESGERVRKFDVEMCDEEGEVCVGLRGVSSRGLEWKGESGAEVAYREEGGVEVEEGEVAVSLAPVWEVVRAEMEEARPEVGEEVLIVGGEGEAERELSRRYPKARLLKRGKAGSVEEIVEELKEAEKIEQVIWLAPERERGGGDEERMIEGQEDGALGCFRVIKALLKMGYGRSEMWFTAITVKAQAIEKSEEINATDASVHGLMGSLAKEYPKWKVRVVDVERMSGAPWAEILRLPADSQGKGWCYREGEWYRQALIPCERERGEERGYRDGGVYVVIGGAGGIGEVFSEYVISEYKARVIWIGRREEDEEIERKRRRLGEKGPEPEYIRGDAANREELERAYQEIKRRHGQVNGVIHSAVGIFDESLEKVEEERFREVLKVKVDASVRIAQVFAGEPLDFVLFFSGMISFSKEAGKAGYSAGCAFKDAYAHQLGQSRRYATKVMNWGWWGEIGAAGVVPKAYRYRVLLAGIGVIEAGEAMEALESLLAGPFDQLGLIKTMKSQLQQWITSSPQQISTVVQRVPSVIKNLLSRESSAFSTINYENTSGESLKAMDARLGILLLSHLSALGLGEKRYGSIREWWTAVGGAEQYGRWLEESLRELRRRGHLEVEGEDCEVGAKALEESREAWTRWNEEKERWSEDGNLRAQVRLVEATLRALPEILTGKIAATEIMFPRSSMELVEGIYKNNRIADCFNEELSERLVSYVDERLKLDREARIRILEIGAGTGGTSAKIFEKLRSYREQMEEYRYTDLSKAFLLHAEEKYGKDAPYLKYGILDAERGLAEQGIEVGSYDVVIAANVLHATKNIRETTRNAKAALKKNGLLLLNEMNGKSLFTHLTFGLLDGWWTYEGEALRLEGSPGLSPESWRRVLEQEGFRGVSFPAAAAHELGLQIIMAESDGVIRQRLKMSSGAAATARREAERERAVARGGSRRAESLGSRPSAQVELAAPGTGSATAAEEQLLREKSAAYLKKLVGKTLKINVNLIERRRTAGTLWDRLNRGRATDGCFERGDPRRE